MPLNTAVGLAIYFAPSILYPHYALPGRTWGPDPLIDQQIAGIVMWGAGDLILLGAVVLGVEAWLRNDERRNRRMRERVAAEADRAAAGNH
jgi:cytochrome c oxidase assembly factor CtaG